MMLKLVGNVQLVAGGKDALPDVLKLLQNEAIDITANPDLYIREHSSFGIDEARELSARATARALTGRRVFIAITPSMTTEAQNALLKTLEEPAEGSLFFFIIPAPEALLPTLRSRSQILRFVSTNMLSPISVKEFLASKPQERLDLLSVLLEKDEDDKRDLAPTLMFLSEMERTLGEDPKRSRDGIEAVYRARKYLGDKGSLMKALLEQVALLV